MVNHKINKLNTKCLEGRQKRVFGLIDVIAMNYILAKKLLKYTNIVLEEEIVLNIVPTDN